MIYTELIREASFFAETVHRGQVRKGKETPYIVHVMAVGLILALANADEEVIAAGILHDTMEDCEPYGSVTRELLEEKFGSKVAQMVDDVTEEDKELPWLERKVAALEHIKHMEPDPLMVKTADVISNMTEINRDLRLEGEVVWERFNASKEDIVLRYEMLVAEIGRVWPENPLLEELRIAHEEFKGLG